jgi:hypothetical protein
MDAHRRSSGPERLNLTRVVNDYEQTLGRPVRPFVLQVTVLPLEGSGGWVLNENHVVVSTHLNDDGDALEAFLRPVLEGPGLKRFGGGSDPESGPKPPPNRQASPSRPGA